MKIHHFRCQAWYFTPAIPALGRLRQENFKFEAKLGYTVNLRAAWDT
jgi:hypothetical protein